MPHDNRVTRRNFLGKAAVNAATVATFAIPTIIPEGVLANPRKGIQGANNRIVVGNIGVGGMGSSHIRSDSAMLCDVDDNHLAGAARRVTQGTPVLVKDFRRILDRSDIDAVTIGTPDHWHAIMTVMACQAGKHVYSEKPTARTIEEGRAMTNAARHYKRIVQIGMQGRSNPNAAAAVRFVRNGGIGKVKRVDIWHPVNFATKDWGDPQETPPGLDWNMWLGPNPWTPYSPAKCHFNFRWFWNSGGGFIRDRGNHALNMVSWITGNDDWRGIVSCEATGTPQREGCFETPATMNVTWEFQNPNWTLTWNQPGEVNKRFPGDWGATYTGDRDDLIVIGGDGGCDTEKKAKEFTTPSGGFEPYLHPVNADPTERHRLNWFDSIRENKRPAADVEIGHHVVSLCILGNISYLLGRKVTYDVAKEQFIGDEAANRMVGAPYRSPWHL